MADTPNRRAASAAAREFLQTKVDRVGDLSEAARAIDAALEARAAADRHVTECQRAYGQARRRAIAAGWTDSELDQLGWPPSMDRSRDVAAAPRPQVGLRSGPRRGNLARLTPPQPRPPRRSSASPGTARASRQALPPM